MPDQLPFELQRLKEVASASQASEIERTGLEVELAVTAQMGKKLEIHLADLREKHKEEMEQLRTELSKQMNDACSNASKTRTDDSNASKNGTEFFSEPPKWENTTVLPVWFKPEPRKSSSSTVTTRTAITTIANTTRSASTSTSTSATPLSSPLASYPWQWIHPIKTGTSFANVLYMLGCPEDYRANWTQSELDHHTTHPELGIRRASLECKQRWKDGKGYDWGKTRPLRPIWWLGDHAYRNPSLADEQIFMTLRDPVDRMISQLFYKRQTNAKTDSEMAQAILQNKRFNSTHFAHHMTTFLFPPAEQQHHSGSLESLTKKACQVVQNMAWVGFVDDFERSVCLLHSRFHFPHHPVEMMNNRPTAGRNKQINVTAVGILVRNQSTILDDGVYNCARERFHRELEQWAPHCI
jgi:hypothetical protein